MKLIIRTNCSKCETVLNSINNIFNDKDIKEYLDIIDKKDLPINERDDLRTLPTLITVNGLETNINHIINCIVEYLFDKL